MQRRTFTEEFKREAVKLARQPGASKAGIARDLGVGANILGRWCREQEGRSVYARTSPSDSVSSQQFESMRRDYSEIHRGSSQ